MIKVSRMVAIALLAALATAGPVLAADPADAVRALYASGLPQDAAGLGKALTADLAAALLKAQSPEEIEANGPALDFDPLTDSQDPQASDLAIETVSQNDGKARVKATFRNAGRPTEILYDLVAEGGAWRVRDISRPETAEGGWDLRLILGLE